MFVRLSCQNISQEGSNTVTIGIKCMHENYAMNSRKLFLHEKITNIVIIVFSKLLCYFMYLFLQTASFQFRKIL